MVKKRKKIYVVILQYLIYGEIVKNFFNMSLAWTEEQTFMKKVKENESTNINNKAKYNLSINLSESQSRSKKSDETFLPLTTDCVES